MDRAVVALILAGIGTATIAGTYALYWLLEQTTQAINRRRRR